MREIKFRARDVVTGEILTQLYMGQCFQWVNHERQNNIIIEQFTGLKDKGGVEIYEGDIIRCGNDSYPAIVEFDECACIWSALAYHNGKKNERMSLKRYVFSREIAMREGLMVIGGRYQNPELLNDQPQP